jgi:hypothetical protein
MRNMLVVVSILTLFLLAACSQNNDKNAEIQDVAAGVHHVVVEEVLQAESYTYLSVTENGAAFWIAITKDEIANGESLYYIGGLEMRNFESKDLGKTFDIVYFIDSISKQPLASQDMPMQSPHGKTTTGQDENISVTSAKNGITVADLFANKKDYAGKTVRIRGKVIKVNDGIMGRNWVHIQDGTKHEDNYDLTVTTDEKINVGDVVTFEGVIALDRDFTAGYFYDVIMEKAVSQVEKAS